MLRKQKPRPDPKFPKLGHQQRRSSVLLQLCQGQAERDKNRYPIHNLICFLCNTAHPNHLFLFYNSLVSALDWGGPGPCRQTAGFVNSQQHSSSLYGQEPKHGRLRAGYTSKGISKFYYHLHMRNILSVQGSLWEQDQEIGCQPWWWDAGQAQEELEAGPEAQRNHRYLVFQTVQG